MQWRRWRRRSHQQQVKHATPVLEHPGSRSRLVFDPSPKEPLPCISAHNITPTFSVRCIHTHTHTPTHMYAFNIAGFNMECMHTHTHTRALIVACCICSCMQIVIFPAECVCEYAVPVCGAVPAAAQVSQTSERCVSARTRVRVATSVESVGEEDYVCARALFAHQRVVRPTAAATAGDDGGEQTRIEYPRK